MSVELTTKQFAERIGHSYHIALYLVDLLHTAGLARKIDFKHTRGKGRPNVVWELPDKLIIDIKEGKVTCESDEPIAATTGRRDTDSEASAAAD